MHQVRETEIILMQTTLRLEATVLPGHRLEITAPELPEGVKVEVILGVEPEAIAVPAPAIQLGPQGPYLFVVKDGVAELRNVVIKRTQNGESVIGKGLDGGEQVVVDGQLRLVNGANVGLKPATSEQPSTATAPPRG